MNKKYILVLVGTLVVTGFWPPSGARASNILFEIPESALEVEGTWGRNESEFGTEIAQRFIPINPPAPEGVCVVSQKIAKVGSPQDNIILDVYVEGAVSTVPRAGEKIASAVLKNADISADTPQYANFHLDNCINTQNGGFYWFVWSRSQPDSQSEYRVPHTFGNYTYWTRRYGFNANTGTWFGDESNDSEWSFRLEAGIPDKEPVVIVPGILGSRLNRVSDGSEIWPDSYDLGKSFSDDFLNDLSLDKNGHALLDKEMKVGDIVDKELVYDFYGSLVNNFLSQGYILDKNLFIATYDWRKSVQESSQTVANKVQEALAHSSSGKINIVSHSMGGLVVKDYLSRQSDLNFLDNVVLVAVPHLGSPRIFNALNYGDNLDIGFGVVGLSKHKVKQISQNMPGVYELLPSGKYIDISGGYVKDFRDNSNKTFTLGETNEFMLTDPVLPDHRNSFLLDRAESVHQNLDNVTVSGAKIYNLVGCGQATMSEFRLYDKGKIDIKMTNGDNRVPISSADYQANQGINYYVLPTLDSSHLGLVQNAPTLSLISSLIQNQTPNQLSEAQITQDQSKCMAAKKKKLLFGIFSPADLHLYDVDNHHTGITPTGDIELGIPESDFFQVGENKFILVPEDHYRVSIEAYATGSFDFKIREVEGDTVNTSVNFLDVPIDSANLKAGVDFTGMQNSFTLSLDKDGNGTFDQSLTPSNILTGPGNEDVTPPTIAITSPTTGIYTRSQIVPVNSTVTDIGSGVDVSIHRFDGLITASGSFDLFFSKLGSHSFEITAYDRAGNLGSSLVQFQSIATISSTISDIERSYNLRWIKSKGVAQALIHQLRLIDAANHPTIQRRLLLNLLKFELQLVHDRRLINDNAYELLKEDIVWLLNHVS